jgi:hypothetical protein
MGHQTPAAPRPILGVGRARQFLAEELALVAHPEGAVEVVRLGAVVAALEGDGVAAAIARAALDLLEEREADARAAGRVGDDEIRDPGLRRGPAVGRPSSSSSRVTAP